MPEREDVTEPVQLADIRQRRAGLRRTMTEVEEASSAALAGRPGQWRAQLVPRVDDLREAWASHVSGTEGPGGLWEQIRADAPRLDGKLRRMGREHEALAAEVDALRQNLADAGDEEARLVGVREQATALLARLTRRRPDLRSL
jgi:hypothetical protein